MSLNSLAAGIKDETVQWILQAPVRNAQYLRWEKSDHNKSFHKFSAFNTISI